VENGKLERTRQLADCGDGFLGRGLGGSCTLKWYLGVFQGHKDCSQYLSSSDVDVASF
jgi:hypothetical protein